MERLQGPINHSILGEHLEVGYLEQLVDAEIRRLEEEKDEQQGPHFPTSPSLEDKMPFLQMLQSPPFSPFTEPTFQTILKLQRLNKAAQPWERNYYIPTEMETTQIHPLELESCITHELLEMGSPKKSAAKDFKQPHSTSRLEGVSSECNQEQTNSVENGVSGSSSGWIQPQISPNKQTHFVSKSPAVATGRERRKRKRTRPAKNKEEVENQRMTHIAVERNRRRQMNDHLAALRSLMPPSYVQRGDQASIIGGAIDFVKELEQLLQSLQAQKRMRQADLDGEDCAYNSSPSSVGVASLDGFLPVQFRGMSSDDGQCNDGGRRGGFTAEKKSDAADIEVTVIQTHVNLKIQCRRRPGQLLKAIVAFEDLRLTVLHLNITSLQSSVLYSFNLKIEDDCKMGSADEIAEAVHKIFNLINGS